MKQRLLSCIYDINATMYLKIEIIFPHIRYQQTKTGRNTALSLLWRPKEMFYIIHVSDISLRK